MRVSMGGKHNDDGRLVITGSNWRYAAVGIALLALVGALYGGAWWLTQRARDQAAGSPAVAQTTWVPVLSTATAIPTVEPPTSRPTTWTVTEMTDPNTGREYYMAPPEVVAMVREGHQGMDDFYREHVFDSTPDDDKRFFAEPLLSKAIEADQEEAARGEASGRAVLLRPDLQILGFSPDGLKVQIGQEFHGESVPVYDRQTRQILRYEKLPVGVDVFTMVYDKLDGHWKISEEAFQNAPPGVK